MQRWNMPYGDMVMDALPTKFITKTKQQEMRLLPWKV